MRNVKMVCVAVAAAICLIGCGEASLPGEEKTRSALYTSGARAEVMGSYNCAGWSASHVHNVVVTLDVEPTTNSDPETGGVFWTVKVQPLVWGTPINGVQPNMTIVGDYAGMRLRDYGGQGFWNIDSEIIWLRSYRNYWDYDANDFSFSMIIQPFSVYIGPALGSGSYTWGWVQWTMVYNAYAVNSTGDGQCKEPVTFLFAR